MEKILLFLLLAVPASVAYGQYFSDGELYNPVTTEYDTRDLSKCSSLVLNVENKSHPTLEEMYGDLRLLHAAKRQGNSCEDKWRKVAARCSTYLADHPKDDQPIKRVGGRGAGLVQLQRACLSFASGVETVGPTVVQGDEQKTAAPSDPDRVLSPEDEEFLKNIGNDISRTVSRTFSLLPQPGDIVKISTSSGTTCYLVKEDGTQVRTKCPEDN